jgi:hypothetical protein
MISATPTNTQFESPDYALVCTNDLLRITAQQGVSPSLFRENSSNFFNVCASVLHIDRFERLGFRLIQTHQFPDIASASKAACSLARITEPNGKFFRIDGGLTQVERKIVWENESTGILMSIRSEHRTIKAQLPWDIRKRATIEVKDMTVLVIDTDYFTKAPVHREQVHPEEWLASAERTVKQGLTREVFNE